MEGVGALINLKTLSLFIIDKLTQGRMKSQGARPVLFVNGAPQEESSWFSFMATD